MNPRYYVPKGGLPGQTDLTTDRAVFTEAYAVLPRGTMRDIVTSALPYWEDTRLWVIARPLSGFAETFSQYVVEVQPGGGSDAPEPDPTAEGVLLVAGGTGVLALDGAVHELAAGSYVYLPPSTPWSIRATSLLRLHWIRRRYVPARGTPLPEAFVTSDQEMPVRWMPNTDLWGTTRFVEPEDLRHDMHVNIVTFRSGGLIPFAETHVMEHGLYVLEGTARYLLNTDWVEVGPGDFMWLRAFCPQACVVTGEGPFRYLLYKDMNRHPALVL